jgi:uroporphyrinogen decarboxylase
MFMRWIRVQYLYLESYSGMNSLERVKLALNHKEPDRVPFDLGGTVVTGIHIHAYQNLRAYLGLPEKIIDIVHLTQQLAKVDDDVMEKLGVDVHNVAPLAIERFDVTVAQYGDYFQFYDEYGIGWRMPRDGGLYYDMFAHPLSGVISKEDVEHLKTPDPVDAARFEGLREEALRILNQEKRALIVSNMSAGIFELYMYTRGFADGYADWAGNQPLAQKILRKYADMQLAYWDKFFDVLKGIPIDVVQMSDDLAGQHGMLVSPSSYRKYLKPLHREIFDYLHAKTEAKIFFHSCGGIRPIIPDLIEIGVDILNPVQVNATGMDSAELKREFGADLTFWGGGIDTQEAFDQRFTPDDVRDDVRRRLDDLMPGGGFVFNPVHNIQSNVPPENIMAMWETLQEFGIY